MAKALFSYSNTEPGFDLDQFDVKGRSRFASIGFEHPFLRSREQSLYGNISFDWRNVESRNNIEATRKDRIRALRIGGRYQVLDQIFSAGLNSFNFQYSQGLDIAGASDKGDANLSRPAGDPQFSKVNAEIQRLQRVTSSVNILLSARGQLSNNALLSSEEFGVGGTGYGRGYDSSEIVGEDGIAGKIEAQWKEPIKADIFESYQVYSFYDVGKVWNDDNTIADDDESLASVGLGIRADFANDFSGGLSVALPLTRKVQTQRDEGARVYFNLNKKF